MDHTLVIQEAEKQCTETELKTYQEMIGSLMWLATISRPDIAYAVGRLATYLANPPPAAQAACKHVFRYLAGTTDVGITYAARQQTSLSGAVDSSWGSKDDSKKSTTGYCFTYAGGLISWASRRQRITATSSTEAEYIAQCSAVKEAHYLRQFLTEIGRDQIGPTIIEADNTGAIALAKNPVQHSRSRHIDFQYHYTREKIEDGTVSLAYVPTATIVADGLTKALSGAIYEQFRAKLGLKAKSAV